MGLYIGSDRPAPCAGDCGGCSGECRRLVGLSVIGIVGKKVLRGKEIWVDSDPLVKRACRVIPQCDSKLIVILSISPLIIQENMQF